MAETVKLPESEDEAALMALLGVNWLTEHAPHRLRASYKEEHERTRTAALEAARSAVQTDCPACHGSGHADDSTEANPVQCMYCGIPMDAISKLIR